MLLSDGAHAYKTLGKNNGIEVRSVPAHPKNKTFGPNHINNVNAYDSRLKGWMFRFKGVATKYLDSYLGWLGCWISLELACLERSFWRLRAESDDSAFSRRKECVD